MKAQVNVCYSKLTYSNNADYEARSTKEALLLDPVVTRKSKGMSLW